MTWCKSPSTLVLTQPSPSSSFCFYKSLDLYCKCPFFLARNTYPSYNNVFKNYVYFLFEESQFDVAFLATSPGALCQKDFSKGKKNISQLFFPPALTTSCGHAISFFLQKHNTDIVYRWHIYRDTMLFPSNGGQAICMAVSQPLGYMNTSVLCRIWEFNIKRI